MTTQAEEKKTKPKVRILKEITQKSTISEVAQNINSSWAKTFKDSESEFETISNIIVKREKERGFIYPLKHEIFAAFDLTPLHKVNVVFMGQDPYHQTLHNGLPRARGISFSVRDGDDIPVSLKNIFLEMKNTIKGFNVPTHGNLEKWAKQGVLMLNMCLTVDPGVAGSHGEIWMGFLNKVIAAIGQVNPKAIFILLGREAQKMQEYMLDSMVALTAPHPSGLSAYKGFFGCDIFNKCNNELVKQNKQPIDWSLD